MRILRIVALFSVLLLVISICPLLNAQQEPPTPTRNPSQSYMDDLLRMQKQDGRDNAFIHYTLASWAMPKLEQLPSQDAMKAILKDGWGPDAATVQMAIARCQPAFDEVRKGAAVDYAKGVGFDKGPLTEVPNFLIVQVTAKMMCIEGRLFEQQGKLRDALDNYLTVLTMGRDYSSDGNTLLSYLISASVNNVALAQIHQLIVSGKLAKPDLQRTLSRLKEVERTQGGIYKGFEAEAANRKVTFQKVKANPKLAAEWGVLPAESNNPKNVEHLATKLDQVSQSQIRYLSQPFWQRDKGAFEREMAPILSDPLVKNSIPGVTETDTRYQTSISKMRQTLLGAAIELAKLDKGRYPQTLDTLVPSYFASLPIDPFTGKPFPYRPTPDGKQYYDYGVGPDQQDQSGAVLYDPTNGTASVGDILMVP